MPPDRQEPHTFGQWRLNDLPHTLAGPQAFLEKRQAVCFPEVPELCRYPAVPSPRRDIQEVIRAETARGTFAATVPVAWKQFLDRRNREENAKDHILFKAYDLPLETDVVSERL